MPENRNLWHCAVSLFGVPGESLAQENKPMRGSGGAADRSLFGKRASDNQVLAGNLRNGRALPKVSRRGNEKSPRAQFPVARGPPGNRFGETRVLAGGHIRNIEDPGERSKRCFAEASAAQRTVDGQKGGVRGRHGIRPISMQRSF